jgi:hypothetical protein
MEEYVLNLGALVLNIGALIMNIGALKVYFREHKLLIGVLKV